MGEYPDTIIVWTHSKDGRLFVPDCELHQLSANGGAEVAVYKLVKTIRVQDVARGATDDAD